MGEGVGRGGDHPLHPPGGRGQETEGGDHGVRFLSPNLLAVLISKYKPTFFFRAGLPEAQYGGGVGGDDQRPCQHGEGQS